MSLIQVENLHFRYPDGTYALRGVDMEVGEGEMLALIGQNGSGKTTLSKCLNGLFEPSEGRVLVKGLDTRTASMARELVTRVGYVFQNPDHQLFNDSVYKELRYALDNVGVPEAEQRERITEAAEIAGVSEDIMSEHPFFLPKGIRQRVAIASILALKPSVIIVDEPTTGQDAQQSIAVMDFLEKIRREEGRSIVIVTHEMSIVARYAQRVVALCEGQVLLDGPTAEVFAQPDVLVRTYVQPPQITQLAHRLAGYGFSPRILTVDEMASEARELLRGSV
jgi:energy-coupling factor transport system ATP-binding protein